MEKDYLVNVVTRSSKDEIVEENDKYLKIKLKASPIKGEANKALVKIIAKHFKTSISNIEIIKGLTSKTKLVRIYQPTCPVGR